MIVTLFVIFCIVIIALYVLMTFPFAKPLRANYSECQSIIIKTNTLHEGDIYRALGTEKGLLEEPFPGVKTLYDIFERGLSISRNGNCLGHRSPSGEYIWESYGDVAKRRSDFASGLVARGAKKGTMVAIFASNCPEWVITTQACHTQSMIAVPLYDTLGSDNCVHILNQTEAAFVVVGQKQLSHMPSILKACKHLKCVIVIGLAKKLGEKLDEKFVRFEHIEQEGQKNPVEHNPPSSEDICTICYTSGTTGRPKGALISHGNLTADLSGVGNRLESFNFGSSDVHISYLPLAHMYERLMHETLFCYGGSVAFFNGDITRIFEDINACRPTIFVSVPRIYSRIHDRIKSNAEHAGKLTQMLFKKALKTKMGNLKHNIVEHWLWDKLVFSKVRNLMGGRVRLMVTGAAPIPDDVKNFLRCCFSCTVMEGYGQTECSAAATSTLFGDFSVGNVGPPIPSVEIKLVDVPEMMYFSSDIPCPRGEICVRGPVVFKGYYKPDEDVSDPFTEDGWLKTGDIGMWNANGTLSIIDRKKNIFKLAQGEYVAPERVESVYLESQFISQIFVYGDSLKARLVAIVIPDEEYSMQYAKENGITATTVEDLTYDPSFKEAVMFDMKTFAARADLKGFETCADIALSTHTFTIENGLLTPTFKLKRAHVYKVFQREIADMYDKPNMN